MDIDRMIKVYIRMRDAKEDMQERHKQELKVIEDQMAVIELEFKRLSLENKVSSFKTDHGTATIVENMKASCNDWNVFGEFVRKDDPLIFLDKRVKLAGIKDFMDMHDGLLPPGISIFRELSLRVTRAKSN